MPIISLCTTTVAVSDHSVLPGRNMAPLGQVRVTHYTHHEGGRITASGYTLRDSDAGRVCAVSRDWWGGRVKRFDVIWLEKYNQKCVIMDTMATSNRKGLRQTKWIDVYGSDVESALDFGIQHSNAYLIKSSRGCE